MIINDRDKGKHINKLSTTGSCEVHLTAGKMQTTSQIKLHKQLKAYKPTVYRGTEFFISWG